MPDTTRHDRNWEAFRYVSGEMPEEDRRAFELRLPDDASLCDAVEQAVELNEAICLASRAIVDVPPRPSTWDTLCRRPEAWAAALAACVLLAVGISWMVSVRQGPTERIASGAGALPTNPRDGLEAGVSLAWADLQRQDLQPPVVGNAQTPPPTPWTEPFDAEKLEQIQSALDVAVLDLSVQTTPPKWLLTAVAGERQANAKETP